MGIACASRLDRYRVVALAAGPIAVAIVITIASCGRTPRTDGPGGEACPAAEPRNESDCARDVASVCTYEIAAVRTVFCHCMGTDWSCGTPLGIDYLEDAPDCPDRVPTSGTACTIQGAPPGQGFRRGCRYEVPARPIIHDCFCAHFASSDARWDCGERGGAGAFDDRGCPRREPVAQSICTTRPQTQCQYGYNLSTHCECSPLSGSGGTREWRCTTSPQPPSPGTTPASSR